MPTEKGSQIQGHGHVNLLTTISSALPWTNIPALQLIRTFDRVR